MRFHSQTRLTQHYLHYFPAKSLLISNMHHLLYVSWHVEIAMVALAVRPTVLSQLTHLKL
jgi:hypothetical protein